MSKNNRNKKDQFDDYLDEKQFWGGGEKKNGKKRKRSRRSAEQLIKDMTTSQEYDTYHEELYEDDSL
jgi:hypothetical protein